MTLADFIKDYYNISTLESICIADAVKKRQWNEFSHTRRDKCLFLFLALFLKTY